METLRIKQNEELFFLRVGVESLVDGLVDGRGIDGKLQATVYNY